MHRCALLAALALLFVVAACGSGSRSGPGTTVTFFYSGGGITNATVEVGPPDTGFGRAIASSLAHDVGSRLVGPHFSAESEDDSYAFRCGAVMVFVSMYEPSATAWTRLLTHVARDCPEKA